MAVIEREFDDALDPLADGSRRAEPAPVDLDADENACPACGTAFAGAPKRCPECGLRIGPG